MNSICKLLFGAAILPASFSEAANSDSIPHIREQELNEIVVEAKRPDIKQQEGKLIYLVKNDPYAKGLDGVNLLGRLPRVAVDNGAVSVAGKDNVRYILDGILLELNSSATAMQLRNLRAEDVEKIELLTTPPSRYTAEPNTAYISIITRDQTLGTKGSVYGSLNLGHKLREYLSGSVSHNARKWDFSLDASLWNHSSTGDNNLTYRFADAVSLRESSTRTNSHTFETGLNGLLRYKFKPSMKAGVIINYNYQNISSEARNHTEYGEYTSNSISETKSNPDNALTITGFYDWIFGSKGESLQVTYNYFSRHSPALSTITTSYDNSNESTGVNEDGKSDYRFHSMKADFKFPYTWAQLEAGVAYTDILNSSDNSLEWISNGNVSGNKTFNIFNYNERIAAAYLTASRSLGAGIWSKIGLRYEHTLTKGSDPMEETTRTGYGRIIPSMNLSWNKAGIGAFNISYSMGMGRPNLWELNPFIYYSNAHEYATGNPELRSTIYNNAEINYYGLGGLYAVLYTSFASEAIGYIRKIQNNGEICTMPYNCLSTNKTGLYANYKRTFFGRWEVKGGGEVFHTSARSNVADYKFSALHDWSGKIELSTSVILNPQKTLIFDTHFTHFFPWQQNLISYRSFQLFNFSVRYSLFNNRLNLQLKANDIFGWNKTRSREQYTDYTINQTYNGNSAYVMLGVSWRFGRDKVASVWRPSKEEHSGRTK
ncbi:MAG: outer membrane beta-barrel family protein [Muribaculaceae bacterium]|nr:outer membrane beta-barrel family protein [Muribaculaceae bacterium]